MIKIFAVEIIESLLPSELEACRLFVANPFFNSGTNQKSIVRLFELLADAVKTGNVDRLDRDDIFDLLYPGKSRVDSKVDKLMSELKGLIEHFLLIRRYMSPQNESRRQLDIIIELRSRGLETRYQQALEKAKKNQSGASWKSLDDHLLFHMTALEEHEWQSAFNKSRGDLNIPDVLWHLDNYYYAQRTELLNRLLLQHRVTVLPPDTQKILDAPWQIPSEVLGRSALIDLSWEIYHLMRQENLHSEAFSRLLLQLKSREKEIKPGIIAQYYTYLRNICINLINAGYNEFSQVLHEIHIDNLERGYFYHENKIPPNACLNITQTALRVNDVEWAKRFLEAHKNRILGDNDSFDFYRMNMALCLHVEKQYDQALDLIPYGSTYSFYHLLARSLELKIYYELGSDLLSYKIDAFKMFISRAGNKVLSTQLYELFSNFINFVRQLSQSPAYVDKARSAQLLRRITEKKNVAERLWLLQKARELGERKKN